MRNLRAYGLSLGEVASQLTEVPGVHALRVAYNPTWLLLYSLEQQGEPFPPRRWAWDQLHLDDHVAVPGHIDLAWRSELWDYFTDRFPGDESPLMVEVLIAPEFDSPDARQRITRIDLPPVESAYRVPRPQLQIITARRATLHRARTPRAPAVWNAATPNNVGSLGGYLYSPTQGLFATTAQHVLSSTGGTVNVAERSDPRPRRLGNAVPVPASTGNAVADETALIAVTMGPPRPATGSLAAARLSPDDLHIGHPLRVRGAMSAHDDVYARAFVSFVTVGRWGAPSSIRVSDGFELRRTKDGIFGTQHQRPTKPGDSGAWIIDPSFDTQLWLGTVVGGEGNSTTATFATNTLDALQSFDPQIRVASEDEIGT